MPSRNVSSTNESQVQLSFCSFLRFSIGECFDVRQLNDLSGPIQHHLMWSIHLPHPPAVSDIYWLTWQGPSIELSALSSNCLSTLPAGACARTALDVRSHAGRHDELRRRQQQLIWPVAPRAGPVDPIGAVCLITIDIRLFANPLGQFPKLHNCASGGPLVAKGLRNPMNSHKHTSVCTAVGKQPVNHIITQDYTIQVFKLNIFQS